MFTTRLLVYGGLAISLCLTVRIQALSDQRCVEKSKHEISSGHRLSVICNGGSVDISITQEQSGIDDYIALDYYCYHLSDPTQVIKNDNLFRYLLPGNRNENYANLVPENSRCVFVGCVEEDGIGIKWYYMRGNGSSCTNEVPETSSSIATSSYVASYDTRSMNSSEITRTIITSTSSVSITNEATSETMASSSTINTWPSSSSILATSEFSEATSKTETFTVSTSSSPSIIDNTVAVIFGVLILVIVLLIISCFIVIACTRKAALCTNKNVIIEIEDSKIFQLILPSEHLNHSHSLHTICADLNFKETSNIDSKENTTHTLETTGGSHTTTTTTTTTDKLFHNNVSTISIEYSEGSSGEVEGSCPALHDTSPAIITVAAQAFTYSSDYVVEEALQFIH